MSVHEPNDTPPLEHVPVLLEEVLAFLQPRPGGRYLDGTAGAGGHSAALLERSAPGGVVVSLDRDPGAVEFARARLAPFGDRSRVEYACFSECGDHAGGPLDGILVDLGFSSRQLDDAERGFSFLQKGPLDMRLDPSSGPPLRALLSRWTERELADVIYQYGEERASRRIARVVREAFKRGDLNDTADLARLVAGAAGGFRHGRIHPATRTFQALRIAVNDELGELERFLAVAPGLLAPGGRLAVISFHSLEDRRVKECFRTLAHAGTHALVTRKPVEAGAEEQVRNSRARSAKLRVLERLAEPAFDGASGAFDDDDPSADADAAGADAPRFAR